MLHAVQQLQPRGRGTSVATQPRRYKGYVGSRLVWAVANLDEPISALDVINHVGRVAHRLLAYEGSQAARSGDKACVRCRCKSSDTPLLCSRYTRRLSPALNGPNTSFPLSIQALL